MKQPLVSVVIVNYNMCEMLRTCLCSLFREPGMDTVEVMVVDNASTDGSIGMVESEFPQTRLFPNRENRGFAGASNQGIAASRGEYVLLLNPDTEIHDRAIERVAEFMQQNRSAGVTGCRLRFVDGMTQHSVGAFPSVLGAFLHSTFLYLLLPRAAIINKRTITLFDYDEAARIDWVSGAFLMIRKEVIGRIGVLDEQFFMYSEEVDFCKRAHDAGFEVWYTPDGTVTHYWGGISAVNRRVLVWLVASQMLYFRKHSHGLERTLLIGLRYSGLALRVLVYAFAGVLTANKSLLAKSAFAASAIYRNLISSPTEVLAAR